VTVSGLSDVLTGLSVFIVDAGDGDDLVDLTSSSLPGTVLGGQGQDEIFGSAFGDVIGGGSEVDEVTAGAGDDIVGADLVPLLTISDATPVSELDSGTSPVEFTITLSGPVRPTGYSVTVDVAVSDGTAQAADSDFTATTTTLTFAPNEPSKTFTVDVIGDENAEFNEVFFVDLTNATGAGILDPRGIGTITNDDFPNLTTSNIIVDEAAGTVTIQATLSVAATAAVEVDFTTTNGSATGGEDFTVTSGILTIPVGQSGGTIVVPITDDSLDEANETFQLTLSNPFNVNLSTPSATVIITDNDVPTVTLLVSPASVAENTGNVQVTVLRNTEPAGSLTVDLSSSLPGDLPIPNSIVIPAGQSSFTFFAAPTNNNLADGDRSVEIRSTAAGFAEDCAQVSIVDDDVAALTLTISAGTTSVNFDITGQNDGFHNGDKLVTITATANATESAEAELTVVDETTLQLTIDGSNERTIQEIRGAGSFVLQRNGTAGDLEITVRSTLFTSGPMGISQGSASVEFPSLIAIPDGQNSVEVPFFSNGRFTPQNGVGNSILFNVTFGAAGVSVPAEIRIQDDVTQVNGQIELKSFTSANTTNGYSVDFNETSHAGSIHVLEGLLSNSINVNRTYGQTSEAFSLQSSDSEELGFETSGGAAVNSLTYGNIRASNRETFFLTGVTDGIADGNQGVSFQIQDAVSNAVLTQSVLVVDTDYVTVDLPATTTSGGTATATISRIETADQSLTSSLNVFILTSGSSVAAANTARVTFLPTDTITVNNEGQRVQQKSFTLTAATLGDALVRLRANDQIEIQRSLSVSAATTTAVTQQVLASVISATIDTVDAGNGADIVFGTDLDDDLRGGAGDDIIIAGLGNDIADGGANNDVFIWADGDGDDSFLGGDGDDEVQFSTRNGISAAANLTFNGGAGDDSVVGTTGTGQNATYLATDPGARTPNTGQIIVTGANTLTLDFEGLTPITLMGAGGLLTIDGTLLPAITTLALSDDLLDTAGIGGNVVTGDGGFETTFFNGFEGVSIIGGTGTETIDLTSIDTGVSLSGCALGGILLDGGADDDVINIADISNPVSIFVRSVVGDTVNVDPIWSGSADVVTDDSLLGIPFRSSNRFTEDLRAYLSKASSNSPSLTLRRWKTPWLSPLM
jgi:hypothetical protein